MLFISDSTDVQDSQVEESWPALRGLCIPVSLPGRRTYSDIVFVYRRRHFDVNVHIKFSFERFAICASYRLQKKDQENVVNAEVEIRDML